MSNYLFPPVSREGSRAGKHQVVHLVMHPERQRPVLKRIVLQLEDYFLARDCRAHVSRILMGVHSVLRELLRRPI